MGVVDNTLLMQIFGIVNAAVFVFTLIAALEPDLTVPLKVCWTSPTGASGGGV